MVYNGVKMKARLKVLTPDIEAELGTKREPTGFAGEFIEKVRVNGQYTTARVVPASRGFVFVTGDGTSYMDVGILWNGDLYVQEEPEYVEELPPYGISDRGYEL